MKKQMLSTIIFIVFFLIGFFGIKFFNGVPVKTKEFSKAGMTITLTNEFVEKSHVSYTAYYESSRAMAVILKEEFSAFEDAEISTNMTLEEYAKLVIQTNATASAVEKKDGLVYFTYSANVHGKEYSYYSTVFRGTDAYWLVQFGCEKENFNKYEKDFIKWAKSFKIKKD